MLLDKTVSPFDYFLLTISEWTLKIGNRINKVGNIIISVFITLVLFPVLLLLIPISLFIVNWYVRLLKKQDFSTWDFYELSDIRKANAKVLRKDQNGNIFGQKLKSIKKLQDIDKQLFELQEKRYKELFSSEEDRHEYEKVAERLFSGI